MSAIFNAVIGTAGHIDHGKSSLVKALTGIDPDRLPEEQDRHITIDLGFAPLNLSNGMRVGIIDVPGHERFIKNMVAGSTGIDFVMLVIAADDGVMAQTREHLQIIQLLGVRDGLTVITKKDLVEPAFLELVEEDIRALEAGTMLDGKPLVALSSKTGEGMKELKTLLEKIIPKLARRQSDGPFRLPIQRVFAKEGFGTVVTGVPLSGKVALGDILEVLPPKFEGRVKGLHAYNEAITQGQAGHSTAVNLSGSGIDKREVTRGMVAVTPGIFTASNLLTAQFALNATVPWPLKHRAAVRYHAGTAEIQGKVLLLEGDVMKPGTQAYVQVLLEEPTVAVPGDRFILRCQSPMITLGGGSILDNVAEKRKRLAPEVLAELSQRATFSGDKGKLIEHLLTAGPLPKDLAQLCSETGTLPATARKFAEAVVQSGKAIALKPGLEFIAATVFEKITKAAVAHVTAFVKEHPALGGIERLELKRLIERDFGRPLGAHFDDLLLAMKNRGAVHFDAQNVALPGKDRKLEGELAAQAELIESAYSKGGLAPPNRADVLMLSKTPEKTFREILKFLRDKNILVDASSEVTFHRGAVEDAKQKVKTLFAQGAERTTSEIRQHLGMNRKFAVPLVELLDREKFTVRKGDIRVLAGS